MHLDDPAMTVDDAVAELGRLGNTIVAVDRPGRRVKVLDTVVQIYPRTVM